MTCRSQLLVFTRYPEPGRTKTRLIPALGAEGAAALQRGLTERIVSEAKLVAARHNVETVIHYAGGNREKMHSWLGPLPAVPQAEGDLGRRMREAFAHAFTRGAQKAVLLGSDIPGLNAGLLVEAFAALEDAQAVIGPSRDGGYYLLGMRAAGADMLYPLLFAGMQWSTPEVFAHTCRRLRQAAVAVAILETLSDIDTPEDLAAARAQGVL